MYIMYIVTEKLSCERRTSTGRFSALGRGKNLPSYRPIVTKEFSASERGRSTGGFSAPERGKNPSFLCSGESVRARNIHRRYFGARALEDQATHGRFAEGRG